MRIMACAPSILALPFSCWHGHRLQCRTDWAVPLALRSLPWHMCIRPNILDCCLCLLCRFYKKLWGVEPRIEFGPMGSAWCFQLPSHSAALLSLDKGAVLYGWQGSRWNCFAADNLLQSSSWPRLQGGVKSQLGLQHLKVCTFLTWLLRGLVSL